MEQYEFIKDKTKGLCFRYGNNACCPSHNHKQIEMLYVVRGSQQITVNGIKYAAKKGDFIFCGSYDMHEYLQPESVSVCTLDIPSEYLAVFEKHVGQGKIACNYLKKCKDTAKIYKLMKKLRYSENNNFIQNAGLIYNLLGQIVESMGIAEHGDKTDASLMNKIICYINENYASDISLESIANECGYNKFYISKKFNSIFNCNINKYINLRRLEAFVNIQAETGDAVSAEENAFRVGFTSMRTFYRVFKDVYFCTPKEYFRDADK